MTIKKGDFVEIEYTGKAKDTGDVFDTTDKTIADKTELKGKEFGPAIICVGKGHVLPGLDKEIAGKEEGKEYSIEIKPIDAFGSKDAKLVQLIPTNKFKQQNIQPYPGLQLNIDGMIGLVKTVSGGRTLVDFNHPLSGKELSYALKINRKVTDPKEKLSGFIKLSLGTSEFSVEVSEGNALVKMKMDLPKEASEELTKHAKEMIPEIKEISFSTEKKEKK